MGSVSSQTTKHDVTETLKNSVTSSISSKVTNNVTASCSNIQSLIDVNITNSTIEFAGQHCTASVISKLTNENKFSQDVIQKATSTILSDINQKIAGQGILNANIQNSETNISRAMESSVAFVQNFETNCSRTALGSNIQEIRGGALRGNIVDSLVKFGPQDLDIEAIGDCAVTSVSNITAVQELTAMSDLKSAQDAKGIFSDMFAFVYIIAAVVVLLVVIRMLRTPQASASTRLWDNPTAMLIIMVFVLMALVWPGLASYLMGVVPFYSPLSGLDVGCAVDGSVISVKDSTLGIDTFPSVNLSACLAKYGTYDFLTMTCGVAKSSINCGLINCRDTRYVKDLSDYTKMVSACSYVKNGVVLDSSCSNIGDEVLFPVDKQPSGCKRCDNGFSVKDGTNCDTFFANADNMLTYKDANNESRDPYRKAAVVPGDCDSDEYQGRKKIASLKLRTCDYIKKNRKPSNLDGPLDLEADCNLSVNNERTIESYFDCSRPPGKTTYECNYSQSAECSNNYLNCSDPVYVNNVKERELAQRVCSEQYTSKQNLNLFMPISAGVTYACLLALSFYLHRAKHTGVAPSTSPSSPPP